MAQIKAELPTKDIPVSTVKKKSWLYHIKKDIFVYILIMPAICLTFLFSYVPLPGISMAFMDYDIFMGFNSPWVGFSNIVNVFKLPMITKAIRNTFTLSFMNLLVGFPAPIIFALLINELKGKVFKKSIQTISYLPHFLSWMSIIGIAYNFYSFYGPINDIRVGLFGAGTERLLFLAEQSFFIPNILILDLWKGVGWGSIIYLATLTAIDPQLYEAACIDGANRWKQTLHITLPGLMPTATMLLILRMGSLFDSNFQLIYGMQNAFIDFEVISTVVYKQGIAGGNYSMATAVGFTQGLIAFLLTFMANKLSKKASGISIW